MAKPDLDFDPTAFIRSSWGLHDINQDIAGLAAALVDELAEQAGMAGDDDAGAAFGRLYDAAADAAVDGIAHATNLIGGGSRTTFQAAVTFMAKDAELAARLREDGVVGPDGTIAEQRTPRCDRSPVGLASALPGVRGTTSAADRWVWGQRFRGSPDKLRTVATTWRKAQRITTRVLGEVQDCWDLVRPARGRTATATNHFFLRLCGYGPCLTRVDEQAALLANLPAACGQLAQACDRYADHIATAKGRVPGQSLTDALTHPVEGILGAPILGGNGEDGGLYDANAADPVIVGLAGIPPALDHTRAKVPVPHPGDNVPWWEKIPIPFPLPGITGPRQPGAPGEPAPAVPEIPVPEVPVLAAFALAPAAYRAPNPAIARKPPEPAPVPPEPGFPPLTPAQRKSFDAWAAKQEESDFGSSRNPNNPANIYQYQVCGYPERVIRCRSGAGAGSKIGADGLRDTDGMAVEGKYVKNPNQCATSRSLDNYLDPKGSWEENIHKGDETEMEKYKAAMAYPGNGGQLRGVEVCTNDRDTVDYFDAMMAARQVPGYARYVELRPGATIPMSPGTATP